jgi:hypothetical protein
MATIENCEDEPIRIPGSIQRHGFLLLLDIGGEHVVGASENAEEFLDIPLKLILGAPIVSILEREILAAVRSLTHPDDTPSLHTFLGSFKIRDELHSVVTHRIDGERVLELERLDSLVSPELINAVITNFVATLSTLGGELDGRADRPSRGGAPANPVGVRVLPGSRIRGPERERDPGDPRWQPGRKRAESCNSAEWFEW